MRDYFRNRQVLGSIRQLDVVVPEFFPKTGLISYYKLDGNSNDAHGSNNGTDTSMSYSAGKINNAGSFNGSSSYINLPSDISKIFEGTKNYTLSFWIKSSRQSDSDFIFNSITSTSSQYNYRNLMVFYNNNKIQIGRYDNSSADVVVPTSSFTIGTWYYITITYDGSYLKVYVNGSYDNQVASTKSASSGGYANIGSLIQGGLRQTYYSGLIDEVGIWSRALTSDEITKLYNSGAGLAYN